MYKVNVTTIDGFQKMYNGLIQQSDFINRIVEPETTEAMEQGTAFHSIIEYFQTPYLKTTKLDNPEIIDKYRDIEVVTIDNKYFVPKNQIEKCYDEIVSELQSPFIHEAKQSIVINDCLVTGKADILDFFKIIELKTTQRYNPKYYGGMQAELYKLIFETDDLLYIIFEIGTIDLTPEITLLNVKNIHKLEYNEPANYQLVEKIINEFLNFIRINNLENYFEIN